MKTTHPTLSPQPILLAWLLLNADASWSPQWASMLRNAAEGNHPSQGEIDAAELAELDSPETGPALGLLWAARTGQTSGVFQHCISAARPAAAHLQRVRANNLDCNGHWTVAGAFYAAVELGYSKGIGQFYRENPEIPDAQLSLRFLVITPLIASEVAKLCLPAALPAHEHFYY